MKKVLFITHDDMSGGSSQSLLAQVEFLKTKKGIDPIVVTWKENSLTENLRKKGIQCCAVMYDFTSVWTRNILLHKIKRPYYRLFYNWLAFRSLRKQIDFSTISLIVSNSSVIDLGAYLHRKLQIPHIWYLREFGDLDFNILSYVKNLPRYIDSNSDGIIAVSNAVAEHWNNRGVKKSIEVIYNGVNSKNVTIPNFSKDSIVNICMCGRLCPAKGQLWAIKSFAYLSKNVLERIRLDFFGTGESVEKLRNLVKRMKMDDYISFKGFSCNIDDELNNYEVGLTLSKAEAFGRATVEYMNHALFVIGTNTGATLELVQNGQNGILIEPDNPIQLARAITDYCENRNKYRENAICSQACSKRKFSVQNNAERAFLFYEKYMER